MDRWILGGSEYDSQKVVILGAGLAGLTAAYELKKNQIPFKVYEGSGRIGGRIWTLPDLNISSQFADLGGDIIEAHHQDILNLLTELKLLKTEMSAEVGYSWIDKGKNLSPREKIKEFGKLSSIFHQVSADIYGPGKQILNFQNRELYPKAVKLDEMSVADFFLRLESKWSPWMKPMMTQWVRSHWGTEPVSLSALELVHWMRDSFHVNYKKFYKISGGAGILTQSLFDRIAGVLPDRWVQFDSSLEEIRPQENGSWSLIFKTKKGRQEVLAQQVICALPLHCLTSIRGWESLPLSPSQKVLFQEMGVASQSRLILSFKERFWQEDKVLTEGGSWIWSQPSQALSQAGDKIESGLNAVHGLLQAKVGSLEAEKVGPRSVEDLLAKLKEFYPKASSFEGISAIHNWKTYPWARGGRCFLKPGQFQKFDLDFQKTAAQWKWAGDAYDLAHHGTMNAAVITAKEAVKSLFPTAVPATKI